ncbi:MAG: thermonuclease family protein [Phyllobacteriaceae bacterium]|nr:thermonuclease family protein [Phyllobacteriaceae bacterium]
MKPPLERIAPAKPPAPSPLAQASAEQAQQPPPSYRFFRPLVLNAGVLVAEGRSITLAGVVPVPATQLCTGADGTSWPCGMVARTALRALVRGRAVTCQMDDQTKNNLTTQCSVAGRDIAEWLVEQGWAEAEPGSTLARLSDAAKAMGRGIHGRPNQLGPAAGP